MKKIFTLIYLILCLLYADDSIAGKRKVLLVGIDGVRADVLKSLNTPAITYLSKNGFGTFESWHQDITISGPSWSSILSGVYHDKHGVIDNSFKGKNYHHYPMIPKLAKQVQPELKFGMYMEWKRFFKHNKNQGWDELICGDLGNTHQTTQEAGEWIVNTDLDFYFVYYASPDFWGHCLGFSSLNPFYVNAIKNADYALGELMKALYNRSNYPDEDWLILVTTDHGGSGMRHGGYSKSERQIFWFAYNERINRRLINGIDAGNKNTICNPFCTIMQRATPVQTDIAITALHHLTYESGCEPESCDEWKLDGRSWLKEMGLNSEKRVNWQLAMKK